MIANLAVDPRMCDVRLSTPFEDFTLSVLHKILFNLNPLKPIATPRRNR